jgi:hypothetical protein
MALTLLEASKLNSGDVKRSAVIEMFAMNSDILRVIPFDDIPGGSLTYNVEGKLPAVAFRGFNEDYGQVNARGTGVVNPQTEVLKIAGGELDVDKQIIRTRGEGTRSTHEAMKVKALALNITAKFINGDSASNLREFDGLRKRIVGNQLVAGDAGGIADGPLSLYQLDTAIDQVEEPTHLIMSKAMRTRLSQAARTTGIGGYIRWDQDEFGKQVAYYHDLPILIADYDDTGARIIDFNEAGPSADSFTETSIYVVSIGPNKVTGLQNGIMEVDDLGVLETAPVYRTRVEWLMGMAVMHGRACARVWGITNAAVVA